MQRYLEYLWMGHISSMRKSWVLEFGDQTEDEQASPSRGGATPPPSPPSEVHSELTSAGVSLYRAGAASDPGTEFVRVRRKGSKSESPIPATSLPDKLQRNSADSGSGASPESRRRRRRSAQSARSAQGTANAGTVGDLPMGYPPGCNPVDGGGDANAHPAIQRSGRSHVVIVEPVKPGASQVSAAQAANAAAQWPASFLASCPANLTKSVEEPSGIIPVPLGGYNASGAGNGGPSATNAPGLLKSNSGWNVVRANKSAIISEKWTGALNEVQSAKPVSLWNRSVEGAKTAALIEERRKKKNGLFSDIDLDGDGSLTVGEILLFLGRKAQEQWFINWSLSLLVAPAVLVYPPLEQLGARSQFTWYRHFNMPPGLRFYLHIGSELALVTLVSALPMPIHRDPPDPYRDWTLFIYAIGSCAKEVEFVICRGISAYLSDPYNFASFIACMLLMASLALNVCNGGDWFFYEGDGIAPEKTYPAGDFRSISQLWERCDEGIVPLGGREILAAAVMLRWLIVIPKMVNRSRSFGPLFLMVQPLMVDVIKWLVLLVWVLATFGMFFRTIYREVMLQLSPIVDLTVGLLPRFSLLPIISLTSLKPGRALLICGSRTASERTPMDVPAIAR